MVQAVVFPAGTPTTLSVNVPKAVDAWHGPDPIGVQAASAAVRSVHLRATLSVCVLASVIDPTHVYVVVSAKIVAPAVAFAHALT